jgi:hypothetical protein
MRTRRGCWFARVAPARPLARVQDVCIVLLPLQVLFMEGGGAGVLGQKQGVVGLLVVRLLQHCLPGRRAFPPLHSLLIISRIFFNEDVT